MTEVSKALERAKEEGKFFLARLTKKELERTGFDTSPFDDFEFVDINLIYDEGQYFLEYIFDGELTYAYHETPQDVGGEEEFREVIGAYLSSEEEKGTADIKMVQSYPLGPDNGSVYIYEVTPHPIPGGMNIEGFYIATFDDSNTEIVWGAGSNPEEALKNAVEKWKKEVDTEENPFQTVYNQISSQE